MKQAGRPAIGLAALLILAACDTSGGSAPGAVSEGEARALEEAAEMLDERRLPEGTLPPIDAPAAATATAEQDAENPEVSDPEVGGPAESDAE